MYRIIYINKFEKNVIRSARRGNNLSLLEEIVTDLQKPALFQQNTGPIFYLVSYTACGNAILKLTGYYFGSKTKIKK